MSKQSANLSFGQGAARAMRVAVVVSSFNQAFTQRLLKTCSARLKALGLPSAALAVEWVPGAFELPLAAKILAATGRFDAVVCLGCVIRGETSHYDLVCAAAQQGILQVGLETGVPVAFGVITTDNERQALARCNGGRQDAGRHAAEAAVWMASLNQRHQSRRS